MVLLGVCVSVCVYLIFLSLFLRNIPLYRCQPSPTPHPTPPQPRLFLRCRELSLEHLGVQDPLQNQRKKKAGVCVSRQDCLAIIIDLSQNMQAYEGLSKFSLQWEMSEGGGGLAERNKEEKLKKQATL